MARTNSKAQLEALRKKQLDIVKKIREAEAKTKKAEREKDERRKLLAGAIALKELEANRSSVFASEMLGLLDQGLTRAADRALFDLHALPKEPKPANDPASSPAPAPFLMADDGGSGVGNG